MNSKEKLEQQLTQQHLDENYLSGKNYGIQTPKITTSKSKGRKVEISAYMLASALVNKRRKKMGIFI